MTVTRPQIALKRVYDPPSESDGLRLLVDRLWPRGLNKEKANIDEWVRDLAPSNELRRRFHSHPEQWSEFRAKYLRELRSSDAAEAMSHMEKLLREHRRVTLLFASKNTDHNNAVVLKQLIEGAKKPPHATKPEPAQARVTKR